MVLSERNLPVGGLDASRYIYDVVVVKIKSRHGIVGLGFCRFFFNRQSVAFCVKVHGAELGRIVYPAAEYLCAIDNLIVDTQLSFRIKGTIQSAMDSSVH